jgi:hypothetical protein
VWSPPRRRRLRLTGTLELGPLNLVMLVLLLYLLPQFTTAGECLHHPLPLKVPAARQVRELCRGPVITAYEDKVLLDGVQSSPQELADGLEVSARNHRLLYDGAPLRRVLLQADRQTPYATLRPLLALVAARGLDLDFVVEKVGGYSLLDPVPDDCMR